MRNFNLWRSNVDFRDFDFYEFPYFEDVIDVETVLNKVVNALSPFQIPMPFPQILADNIYDYCYGRQCNLKNTDRWEKNFLGEISIFLLERGRYLQAYVRDVNKNIELDGTSKTKVTGEEISGNATTKKTGNVETVQQSDVSGTSSQQGLHELGDTLTVLNNTTTSTTYLASANEENYSRGSVTENSASGFGKSVNNSVNLGVENGGSLSDSKHETLTETEGTKSPLDIANEESNFKFQEWIEPLLAIIDTYFTAGGAKYA